MSKSGAIRIFGRTNPLINNQLLYLCVNSLKNTVHKDSVLEPLTLSALCSSPALLTHLSTRRITVEMAKKVISCSAEFVAEWAVVIGVAAESQAVFQSE